MISGDEWTAAMMMLTLMIALAFAAVHLFAARLRFLDVVPRSRWLSAAGGVSVAYVFVHLLPELAEHQQELARVEVSALSYIEHHAYLIALAGLICFYGLERMVKLHHGRRDPAEAAGAAVFWLHITAFSFYNALIGYLLLHREQPGYASLLWYALAMGLHFFVNDYGLRQDHRQMYYRRGRWLLAAAVLAGWLLGVWLQVPALMIPVLTAFLAGGVVLNVLKEELPEQRQSRFSAFLAGALIYALILQFV